MNKMKDGRGGVSGRDYMLEEIGGSNRQGRGRRGADFLENTKCHSEDCSNHKTRWGVWVAMCPAHTRVMAFKLFESAGHVSYGGKYTGQEKSEHADAGNVGRFVQ